MPDRLSAYAKGVLGEERALTYLEKKGMVLLQRRYHSPFGEIDLVMLDGDVIAAVEVKLREQSAENAGFAAITATKRRRLEQTARYYLAEHGETRMLRFDALEITPSGIRYLPDAFEA